MTLPSPTIIQQIVDEAERDVRSRLRCHCKGTCANRVTLRHRLTELTLLRLRDDGPLDPPHR